MGSSARGETNGPAAGGIDASSNGVAALSPAEGDHATRPAVIDPSKSGMVPAAVLPSAPTRKTLTFPASEVRRAGDRSPSKIPTSKPPAWIKSEEPLTLSTEDDDDYYDKKKKEQKQLKQLHEQLSASTFESAIVIPNVTIPKNALVPKDVAPIEAPLAIDRVEELDEAYLTDEDERPSERSTVPTLASKGVAAKDASSDPLPAPADPATMAIQLSASELKSDREVVATPKKPAAMRERLASTIPPPLPAQWKWRREVSLHTLLKGQPEQEDKRDSLELELGEDEQSDPIELARVSRPAFRSARQEDESHAQHEDGRDRDDDTANVQTDRPPMSSKSPGRAASLLARLKTRRAVLPLVATHLAIAAVVALVVGSGRPPAHAQKAVDALARQPRAASSERKSLVSAPGATTPAPPAGGCTTTGAARSLATRAQIGPGLEVSVLDTGFGLALASGTTEAVGLRIEGSWLRVAETVRVKASTLVSHVAVDGREDEGGDGFDIRIDSDDARTVVGSSESPTFRVVARGGYIMAIFDDPNRMAIRNIWPVPGILPPTRTAALTPPASPYRPPGFLPAKDAAAARKPIASAPAAPIHPYIYASETVRAVGRDDGGVVIALRRPSSLWLGVTDSALAPAGAMVNIRRNNATVGTPAITQWGGGGAVAWAERAAGEREWSVVVAGFTPDGEGATTVGPVRTIAKGMSPSIATLADGDLLLAMADGTAGAHRVITYRLGARDLDVRGEPIIVSPDTINAGQPAVAVRPDGRSLVAFFAAERGRAASVYATPLMCDPGL